MDKRTIYEIIGYVASVLVAVSLMMTSILRLRIINLIGAACFTAYGLLIGAYPIAVVNALIVLINLYYLYDTFTTREYFSLLAVRPDSAYLLYFLKFYAAEIKKFFPAFHYEPHPEQVTYFMLRDLVPAGLFIAVPHDSDALLIKLDFVIPGYRDFKIGKFLFVDRADEFRRLGVRALCSAGQHKQYEAYLRSMGFVPTTAADGACLYRLDLA